MERDRFGLVGGLVADRPVLTAMVLAFGLTAMVAVGASGAAPAAASAGGDLTVAALALIAVPLFIAGVAPRSIALRIGVGVLAAVSAAAFYAFAPAELARAASAPSAIAFAALTAALLTMGPMVGPMLHFAFIAAAAGLLGMAGAIGLMLRQNIGVAESAPALVAGFAAAAVVGAGAVADFAGLFAGGADRRHAAGQAASRALAPCFFAAVAAVLAFGGAAAVSERSVGAAVFAGLCGLAVVLSALPALAVPTGALGLRRTNESMAVEENRRRQAFRRLWRPIRGLLPANASLAIVAIAAIAVVAAAFNVSGGPPGFPLAFTALAAVAAGFVFFSLRVGLFVFFMLMVSSSLGGWLWTIAGAAALAPFDAAAAQVLAAVLFGGLATTWRDARSPRLNPRETTEAAMTDGFGEHVFGVVVGLAGFYAGSAAGAWPGGLAAGCYLALMAAIGLLLAPALMTALSRLVRRELA